MNAASFSVGVLVLSSLILRSIGVTAQGTIQMQVAVPDAPDCEPFCWEYQVVVEHPGGTDLILRSGMGIYVSHVAKGSALAGGSVFVPSPFSADDHFVIDRAIYFDDAIQLVVLTIDRERRDGTYSVYLWPLEPGTGLPLSGPRPIDKLVVDLRESGYGYIGRSRPGSKQINYASLDLHMAVSADGQSLVMLNDKMIVKEKDSEVPIVDIWVIGKDGLVSSKGRYAMPPVQRHLRRVKLVGITSSGTPYCYWQGRSAGTPNKETGLSSVGAFITFHETGYRIEYSVEVGLKDQICLTEASRCDDGSIIVTGFVRDNGKRSIGDEYMTAVVVQRFDPDLTPLSPAHTVKLKQPELAYTCDPIVLPRSDGGFYLAGALTRAEFGVTFEQGVLAVSMSAKDVLEWHVKLPRAYYRMYNRPGIAAFLQDDELHLVLAEHLDNPAKIAAGKKPSTVRIETKVGIMHVDLRGGKPRYNGFDVIPYSQSEGYLPSGSGVAAYPCVIPGAKGGIPGMALFRGS